MDFYPIFVIGPSWWKIYNFDIETAKSPLSFWKKSGGKLVLLIVIALLIWGSLPSKDDKEEVKPTNI